jgi:hypothetical protein
MRKKILLTLEDMARAVKSTRSGDLFKSKNSLVAEWRDKASSDFYTNNSGLIDVYISLPDGNQEWIAASDEFYWEIL